MNYQDYITIDPNKHSGKPCIRDLRITVYDFLDYLASDMTVEEILDDFPDLTREDIKAVLTFAADCERKLFFQLERVVSSRLADTSLAPQSLPNSNQHPAQASEGARNPLQ